MVLAVIAARLLVSGISKVVRLLTRPGVRRRGHAPSVSAPVIAGLLPSGLTRFASNGERAPPLPPVMHRLAHLG